MVEFGRTGVSAMCLGICEAALRHAASFLQNRRAFGQSLSDNDVVLAKLADLRVRVDAARLLTERSAALVDAGARAAAESAMAKLYSSELAVELTAAALHLHGGIGATTQTPLARMVRDSHAFTIGEGTSEVLRKIIGRAEVARTRKSSDIN
jgi:alkylation response protein AidB-like acyl-CoA dehydrogenase